MKRLCLVATVLAAASNMYVAAQTQSGSNALKDTVFVVKLLSPISTKTSNQGDMFTATVEEPTSFEGAVIEGRITKLEKPKKGVGKGQAQIAFEFDSLTVNGKTSKVTADVKEVTNSKGTKAVDEEGQVIGITSNKKRIGAAIAGAGLGSLLGGLAGGLRGAAVGSAAGLAVGVAVGLTMTTAGSDIEFLPGSHFTLNVSDNAGTRTPSRQ